MKAILENNLTIEGLTPSQHNQIVSLTTIPNPLYHKLMRMGNRKALYACPKEFKFYSYKDGKMVVGRGLLGIVRDMGLSFEDHTSLPRLNGVCEIDVPLRDYQQKVFDNIGGAIQGVIELGTGYGKTTAIASQLIRIRQTPTLVIVPRTHLAHQFAEAFHSFFGYKAGFIQGYKNEVKDVTVATFQTLASRHDLCVELKHKFGMVIVDECHTAVTDIRIKTIEAFAPRYLYGMTATARRNDGKEKAIQFVFGDILVKDKLPQEFPAVRIIPYHGHIPLDEYALMVSQQIKEKSRNALIVECVRKEIAKKRKVLVLTKRVEHYVEIQKSFPLNFNSYTIDSGVAAKKRADLLESLRGGELQFDILLGTYSMLATGTDIPSLDTLIFAGDVKSDILTEQSAGRILRIFEGKQKPLIIDIEDRGNRVFLSQAKLRQKFYRQQQWQYSYEGNQRIQFRRESNYLRPHVRHNGSEDQWHVLSGLV